MGDKEEVRLIMVGKTGVGKSSTGNTILGTETFVPGVGARSVTVHSSYGRETRLGRKVLVVDTPGLYDTERSQGETEVEIAKFLMIAAPGPHAILMVVSAAARFTEEEAATLNRLRELFGEDMMRYLIVLVTRADELMRAGMGVREFVEQSPQLLKSIVTEAGNRVIAFHNLAQGPQADSQVASLFQLVEDTVQQNGGTHYTPQMFEAAAELMRQREEELRRQQEEEQRRIREEMEAAARQKAEEELEERRRQLEEEAKQRVEALEEEAARKLEMAEAEQRRLADEEMEKRYAEIMEQSRAKAREEVEEEMRQQQQQQQQQQPGNPKAAQQFYAWDMLRGMIIMNAGR